MIIEQPICKVTPIVRAGVNTHSQMDENSLKTGVIPNGTTVWGYEVATSSEKVDHVRVSTIGAAKIQWVRISERDGTNRLVNITYLVDPNTELAASLTQIAQTQQDLTKAIKAHTQYMIEHG